MHSVPRDNFRAELENASFRAAAVLPLMQANEYDLVVIGSGPAGQQGAICAAKMRKKVAIIDRRLAMEGVCVHSGTIPSKVLRDPVLYLSGLRQRMF